MYREDEEFIKKAARIFEQSGDRYSKPMVTPYPDLLSVYGLFTRQKLIRIAEAILEVEGFVIFRGATRRSLLKEIAQRFSPETKSKKSV